MELKKPPKLWAGVRFLPPDLKEWCQRQADHHYAHGGSSDEAELSTDHFPLCASPYGVRPHIDEFGGEELGKRIFGLVIRSDSHSLHTDMLQAAGRPPIPLNEGDVYSLDPHDRHWTVGEGQLIFAATFLPFADDRFNKPKKIAHDLQWELLKARIDGERKAAHELAIERYRYRGISHINDALQPVAPDVD